MSGARLAGTALLSVGTLPCLGFGVVGMLASFEVTGAERWTAFAIYATIEVGMLLGLIFVWRWALAPDLVPGACGHCGYQLRGVGGDHCPECGATIDEPR